MHALFYLALLGLFPPVTLAANHAATITRKIGKVSILTNPQKSVKKQAGKTTVLFDGLYYDAIKAKRGVKLQRGSVIQTGKSSRARLVFDNGDQVTVSPLSAYKISWESKKGAKPVADLIMGKIRATVQKGGPRSGMKVRTRSAVMGVRGTDFFVAGRNNAGQSEVSVLRGVVAVAPKGRDLKQAAPVAAGFSAAVAAPKQPLPAAAKTNQTTKQTASKPEPAPPAIAIKKTTKRQVVQIQKATVISKKIKPDEKVDKETKKRLRRLEKKAIKNVVTDIKLTDPKLYAALPEAVKKGRVRSVDSVLTRTTKKALIQAPEDPKTRVPAKPSARDLNRGGIDAYDKYFNLDED